jgi:hypothetical protein
MPTKTITTQPHRLDKGAFTAGTFAQAEEADRLYWAHTSRAERMAALELQRQIAYGYETAPRLQRIFEVTQR